MDLVRLRVGAGSMWASRGIISRARMEVIMWSLVKLRNFAGKPRYEFDFLSGQGRYAFY